MCYERKPTGQSTHIDVERACILGNNEDELEFVPQYSSLTRIKEDYLENSSIQGGVLSPGERATFSGQIGFREVFYEDPGSRYERVPITKATQRLYDAGIRSIQFQIYVLYTDVNDEVYAEQVMGKIGSLDRKMSLEDVRNIDFSTESSSNHQLLNKVDEEFRYPP